MAATQAHADAGTNDLVSPYNIIDNTIVFARVENEIGCYSPPRVDL